MSPDIGSKSLNPRKMKSDFTKVGELLQDARRVLFITGAGVSAESQIPTFRGATAAFADGMTEDGLPFEEVLSAETFQRNPELSWKYFFLLELSIRGKLPNSAHRAMAALQTPRRKVYVATQNIDELHQRAGSQKIFELHGNLRRIICTKCDYHAHRETYETLAKLPRCPQCQAILRPDIVLYGENLPQPVLDAFRNEQNKGFDLVFSVGTTSLFLYVIEPVAAAARRGIPVVEINPETTPISNFADFRFTEPAGETLRRILEAAAIN
jgi:NAD-dependent deacetylase